MNGTIYLTYDLSQWGFPDGQLQITTAKQNESMTPTQFQNTFNMTEFKYYGTAFNKAIEYEFGYIETFLRFQGFFIGGNINNPLGPAAGSGAQVGQAFSPTAAPAFIAKWNINSDWYDRFGIQRSMPGTTDPRYPLPGYSIFPVPGLNTAIPTSQLGVEAYTNPTGFNFTNSDPCYGGYCYNSPRALFINEIGWQVSPGVGHLGSWYRLTGYYNTTDYFDYSKAYDSKGNPVKNPTTKNYAVSFFGDQQIWQPEPGPIQTAYKGIYVGFTAAYDDPKADQISQDYQARIYSFGLFGRPRDQLSLIYEREVMSPDFVKFIDTFGFCSSGFQCANTSINTYTVTYTANIMPGLYVSAGVQYSDHAAINFSPLTSSYGATVPINSLTPLLAPYDSNHSLNFIANVLINF
jgi:porin